MTTPLERLNDLGLQLPPAAKPQGMYVPTLIVGDLLYTAGHLPIKPDGSMICGIVGEHLDVEAGQQAAQIAGLAILSSVQAALGDLDRVKQLVKVMGLVNCGSDFTQHPQVINGCSALFKQVFGDQRGTGTRSAFGAVSLPLGVAVEIEAVFEIMA